jgi:Ca2+-binding EF-hand superfamily protein
MAASVAPSEGTALSLAGREVATSPKRKIASPTRSGLKISMHESICQKDMWKMPSMTALDQVRLALEKDERSQSEKYGSTEPTCLSARFHVTLPQSPQHSKFCYRPSSEKRRANSANAKGDDGQEQNTETAEPVSQDQVTVPIGGKGRERYDKRTLLQWFRDMDQSDSGFVTTRAIIVFLRQRRVQAMRQKHDFSEEALLAQRNEVHRIHEMIKGVDKDGKGSVNWDDFTDIFRRAGILLEYDADRTNFDAVTSNGTILQSELRREQKEHRNDLEHQEGISDTLAHELRKSLGPGKEHRYRLRRYGSVCGEEDGLEMSQKGSLGH